MPGKYKKSAGNQTARGFIWFYFSSGVTFITVGGNFRLPPLNDSPEWRMGLLWLNFSPADLHVGLLPTQTIYFWVVEICFHVQTCILIDGWAGLCSSKAQWFSVLRGLENCSFFIQIICWVTGSEYRALFNFRRAQPCWKVRRQIQTC